MKKEILAVILAVAPLSAMAGDCGENCNALSYTYIEGGYVYDDGDGYDGNGAGLKGAFAFTDNFFATASYSQTRDSDSWRSGSLYSSGRYTHKNWTLGVGFNQAIGSRADWVSQLAYARHENDFRSKTCVSGKCDTWGGDFDLSGYNISTGIRGRVTDKLVGNAYLGYEDYNHRYDGNFYAELGLGYSFNSTWGVQSGVRVAEHDEETWNLGVRASF